MRNAEQALDRIFAEAVAFALCVALVAALAFACVRLGAKTDDQGLHRLQRQAEFKLRQIRPAIPVPDMGLECITCSQTVITDGCVPSLCVRRPSGALCCNSRKFLR